MERTKNARPRPRSPSTVERLEERRLCSVTVSQGYPGYYTINGDNGANTIAVSVDQNARTFTLNGATYGGVAYLTVNGYEGNDFITVAGSPGPIGCTIIEGNGNDSVSLSFDGAIYVGGGQDIISLKDSFQGEIHTGDGNDQITLSGYCANAVVYAGNGNNLIDASGNLYGVAIFAGNGDNLIYGSNSDDLISVGGGSNVICCLNGNDTVYCRNGSPDTVIGGSGNDTVYGDSIDSIYNVQAVFLA
jgi:Ca2+-binding RTX toxin-like protein